MNSKTDKEIVALYYELLKAVGKPKSDEELHKIALRYIKESVEAHTTYQD